jgi:hypothetical protein
MKPIPRRLSTDPKSPDYPQGRIPNVRLFLDGQPIMDGAYAYDMDEGWIDVRVPGRQGQRKQGVVTAEWRG